MYILKAIRYSLEFAFTEKAIMKLTNCTHLITDAQFSIQDIRSFDISLKLARSSYVSPAIVRSLFRRLPNSMQYYSFSSSLFNYTNESNSDIRPSVNKLFSFTNLLGLIKTKTTIKLITLWLPLFLPDIFSVFDILTIILVAIKL